MRHSKTIFFTLLSVLSLILGTVIVRGSALGSTGFMLLAFFLCPLSWKLLKKRVLSAPIIIVCALILLFQTQYHADSNSWTINKELGWNQTQERTENNSQATIPESSDDLADLEVHYIDVGQGDATLVTCKGKSLLIDAGENNKGTVVRLYLKKQNIERLDYVIATHPDSDHIGGMDVIFTKYDCGTIIMPEKTKNTATYRDMISAMNYRNYESILPQIGASYQLGDAVFTIIAPNRGYGDNINDWSVGILLTHGENRFVFTGDAEWDAEYDMVGNGIDLSCDVYKVGHHGSETSTTDAILDAMNPFYAVISCGKDNKYGHPREQILNRLKERNIQVFRTDGQGSIVARSDGTDIQWSTQYSQPHS